MIFIITILFLGILFIGADGQDTTNAIITWTGPDCRGICSTTALNKTNVGKNISIPCAARSFQLLYPLQGQEQLDFSYVGDNSLLQPGDEGIAIKDPLCGKFEQSYYAHNGSTTCHNMPDFTCLRWWTNSGVSSRYTTHNFSTSTSDSRSSCCIPQTGSLVHTHSAKLNPGASTGFWPSALNASKGDYIHFSACSRPFYLFTTSLEEPCTPLHQLGNGSFLSFLYQVESDEPLWIMGCQATGPCICTSQGHFALNPGSRYGQFQNQTLGIYETVTRTEPETSSMTIVQGPTSTCSVPIL